MNKFYIIGIGYRPLDEKTSGIIKNSEVILTTERLFEVFKRYAEFNDVKERLKITASTQETIAYIRDNYERKKVSVLADGDPMFFGFGRLILSEFNKSAFEVFPDLSSIQVAFSRIKESWGGAFLMSLHGGPDPTKRRRLEYDIEDIPALLERHNNIAILTDKEKNPSVIAAKLSEFSDLRMYVCEKLGYHDEKITEGTPEEISAGSFSYPNVVIILRK
jgi:precorrin-6Y C5,15-methyltransferase (decarboxylating)